MNDFPLSLGVLPKQSTKPYIIHTQQYELVNKMVEVYERGQIVIPKYIRDMLNIMPGTRLNASVENNKIILEKSNFAEELEAIRAEIATPMSKDEVEAQIKKSRDKMHKEWLDVYRR